MERKQKFKVVPWEHSPGIDQVLARLDVYLDDDEPNWIKSAALIIAAIKKANSIVAVDVSFGEKNRYYQPFLRLVTEKPTESRSVEIFLSSDSTTESVLPDICIRTAYWSRNADKIQTRMDEDLAKYIQSERHFGAQIVFARSADLGRKYIRLLKNIRAIAYNPPISVVQKREDPDFWRLEIIIKNEDNQFSYSYFLAEIQNETLESFAVSTLKYLQKINTAPTLVNPTSVIAVYNASVWESLSEFGA